MRKVLGLTTFIGTGVGLLIFSAIRGESFVYTILLLVVAVLFFIGLPDHYKELLK
ncbi:hypothetical protein [Alkaliphilus metalliredigens]|nr:hypothetical protein [Alkaliphilus metalliredigens]